jgi:hypothetical protein
VKNRKREVQKLLGNNPIWENEMIDMITHKRLSVSTEGDAGPYIMVPLTQLERVKALLDADKCSYWVDEEVISLDGKPEVAVINLARRSDPKRVQHLLDSIP